MMIYMYCVTCTFMYSLQGIDPIVIMAKDGLFHGTPDEKEESARVIILLVHLSPVEVILYHKIMFLSI